MFEDVRRCSKSKTMKKKRARISMAIQWTSGTRDTVLELQKRIGNSWNFHGIFCIKVSSGWMFLMSPWVGYSWWHWKLWKLENTENEAAVLALRVCVVVVMYQILLENLCGFCGSSDFSRCAIESQIRMADQQQVKVEHQAPVSSKRKWLEMIFVQEIWILLRFLGLLD